MGTGGPGYVRSGWQERHQIAWPPQVTQLYLPKHLTGLGRTSGKRQGNVDFLLCKTQPSVVCGKHKHDESAQRVREQFGSSLFSGKSTHPMTQQYKFSVPTLEKHLHTCQGNEYKYVPWNIVCNCKKNLSIIGKCPNKLWYSHTIEYYAAGQKNCIDLSYWCT